ncbi:MAG: SIR2 family protein [Candidatus Aminicenantes bacterium]|nr:SIR2 family protein [Candidatus Aminicenantes bacterium]
MILDKTVLVLGAGASKDYGYPTGIELKANVIQHCSHSNEGVWNKFNKSVEIASMKKIENFGKDLHISGLYSVDAFLEKRPEFIKIGKFDIALHLIQQEKGVPAYLDLSDSWYHYIWNKLVSGSSFETFNENNLSIVTFNYDRCLEYFFMRAMKSTFNKKIEDCALLLKEIPIIHVYGKLGDLTWEDSGIGYKRKYEVTNEPEEIIKSSQHIEIITDQDDNIPSFLQAFKILNQAEKIIFLGFGYHDVNLGRLKIKAVNCNDIVGSGYGLYKKEMINIRSKWKIQFLEVNEVGYEKCNNKITTFLKKYIDLK